MADPDRRDSSRGTGFHIVLTIAHHPRLRRPHVQFLAGQPKRIGVRLEGSVLAGHQNIETAEPVTLEHRLYAHSTVPRDQRHSDSLPVHPFDQLMAAGIQR